MEAWRNPPLKLLAPMGRAHYQKRLRARDWSIPVLAYFVAPPSSEPEGHPGTLRKGSAQRPSPGDAAGDPAPARPPLAGSQRERHLEAEVDLLCVPELSRVGLCVRSGFLLILRRYRLGPAPAGDGLSQCARSDIRRLPSPTLAEAPRWSTLTKTVHILSNRWLVYFRNMNTLEFGAYAPFLLFGSALKAGEFGLPLWKRLVYGVSQVPLMATAALLAMPQSMRHRR